MLDGISTKDPHSSLASDQHLALDHSHPSGCSGHLNSRTGNVTFAIHANGTIAEEAAYSQVIPGHLLYTPIILGTYGVPQLIVLKT